MPIRLNVATMFLKKKVKREKIIKKPILKTICVLVSAKALNGQIEQVEFILPCGMEIKIKHTFNTSALCCVQDKKNS